MTGAEVDAIKEADDARIWEERNAENPYTIEAVDLLTKAIALLEMAHDKLTDAANVLGFNPDAYRIESFGDDMGNLASSIRQQIERMA
jgi:hypothetical protein